ncbi:hypothetical protein NB231_15543 [Nitrococcus mobilis Nb-231]|uniref:Uncharacterized protein n=1 Tax=Nitrococcus mobilis Nb-231 TaxID=314278 RepID=A4BLQ9_9GAMM|nr:hypothetical protein NB231_15543 [Nitrococcus mobilis Nb-231]
MVVSELVQAARFRNLLIKWNSSAPGLAEAAGGFIVADSVSSCIELLEGEAGFEVVEAWGSDLSLS